MGRTNRKGRRAHAQTTFVIANNHFEAKAAVNALELIHLLERRKNKSTRISAATLSAAQCNRRAARERAYAVSAITCFERVKVSDTTRGVLPRNKRSLNGRRGQRSAPSRCVTS